MLSGLNTQQRAAVRHISSPLLVLAGAGSGKTRVITHKIAWLILEQNHDPENIYAVTFTNKAAREMKNRVQKMMHGENDKRPNISTFHSLGLNIVRQEHHALGLRPGFSILDPEDCNNVVASLLRDDLTGDKGMVRAVYQQISSWKNGLRAPGTVELVEADGPEVRAAARIYSAYEELLRAYNAVDLDDLVYLPVRLLQSDRIARLRWQGRIKHLLVDEYQDTNSCQFELVKLLTGEEGGLTVVGDDDQSIYGWRGAQVENLSLLKQGFPDLRIIKLEQNYRSTGRILKVANQLISHNSHLFEKKLWSNLGYGDPVRIIESKNDEHEAERVVSDLQYQTFRAQIPHHHFAILYRGNHQSRLLERMLRERNIPYYISGGISFFDRTEIRDLMAYFRLVTNPDDDNAFLRIVNTPRRYIGARTLEQLSRFAAEQNCSMIAASQHSGLSAVISNKPLAQLQHFGHWLLELNVQAESRLAGELARNIVNDIHYVDWLRELYNEKDVTRRVETVEELLTWIDRLSARAGNDSDFTAILARLLLAGSLEQNDENSQNGVALMTLHAAKGLEFPHVYIVGMEENILPHHACQDIDTLDEERRLAYVGVTRARNTLVLSLARHRRKNGELVECEPSRFLGEMPAEDLQWSRLKKEDGEAEDKEKGAVYLDTLRQMLNDA